MRLPFVHKITTLHGLCRHESMYLNKYGVCKQLLHATEKCGGIENLKVANASRDLKDNMRTFSLEVTTIHFSEMSKSNADLLEVHVQIAALCIRK